MDGVLDLRAFRPGEEVKKVKGKGVGWGTMGKEGIVPLTWQHLSSFPLPLVTQSGSKGTEAVQLTCDSSGDT